MFDIPNTNKTIYNEQTVNLSSITEALNEEFYNNHLLDNVKKLCQKLFPSNFENVQNNGYTYCGWIFPDGTTLDTDASGQHFWYEKRIKDILGDDIEFLKLGLIRYNIKEGLVEFPYTPVTEKQLKVLDYVFDKYFKNCQFKFGGGGDFRFGDNYKQNAFYIDPNVYEDEYPFKVIYRRDGKDMAKLIRNYCYTGKIEENIK